MTKTRADIYLRLSDMRDGNDDTFTSREADLRALAGTLGWTVARVLIENDVNAAGRRKPASAYKTSRELITANGIRQLRTTRPVWAEVLQRQQAGTVTALLVEDSDRIARNMHDGLDLVDVCRETGSSVRCLADDYPDGRAVLTNGGIGDEVSNFLAAINYAAKASADTSRRVANGRKRWAAKGSYGGGPRPFGYQSDPDAPKHRRTLIMDEAEAEVIRQAASAVLAGVSLRFLARDLRERGVPTVTGARWTPDTLRGALLKPAVAGLAVHTSEVKVNGDAPRKITTTHRALWPAILERDEPTVIDGVSYPSWQSVVDKLTDPDRTTRPAGAVPRWLVSGIARCHCGALVYCRGAVSGRPSYVCRSPQAHLRRTAPATDDYVSRVMIARLNRPDMADLLRPPARPGIDVAGLRQQAAGLRETKAAQVRLHAAGAMDDDDLAEGLEIRRRLAQIDATLTATSEVDPLAEFRDGVDAAVVWNGDEAAGREPLSLARKRALVALLAEITLLPARPGAPRRFDPNSVSIRGREV